MYIYTAHTHMHVCVHAHYLAISRLLLSFSGDVSGKVPTCQFRRNKRWGFDPWVWKIPWRRAWQLIPIFLPGESQGQSSLPGFGPIQRVTKNRIWLKQLSMHAQTFVRTFKVIYMIVLNIGEQVGEKVRYSK